MVTDRNSGRFRSLPVPVRNPASGRLLYGNGTNLNEFSILYVHDLNITKSVPVRVYVDIP